MRCTWSHWRSQLRLIINFGFDAFTSLLFPVVVGFVVYSFLKLPVTLEGIHSIAQGMIRKENVYIFELHMEALHARALGVVLPWLTKRAGRAGINTAIRVCACNESL